MVVGIVFSDEYRQLTCTSPKFLNRYAMVMDLINAYGIVRDMVRIPPASFASDELAIKELSVFHSYVTLFFSLLLVYMVLLLLEFRKCRPLALDD
ncbi:unnamed protein product [Dicrocoelium dendriticum]|nr:unnamed protein product [Dicrocoelium dendriticum]